MGSVNYSNNQTEVNTLWAVSIIATTRQRQTHSARAVTILATTRQMFTHSACAVTILATTRQMFTHFWVSSASIRLWEGLKPFGKDNFGTERKKGLLMPIKYEHILNCKHRIRWTSFYPPLPLHREIINGPFCSEGINTVNTIFSFWIIMVQMYSF